MKKFSDIPYQRLDYLKVKSLLDDYKNELEQCKDKKSFLEVFRKINDLSIEIENNYDYVDIQNGRYLTDEFYQKEIDYWNQYKGKFDLLFTPIYKICFGLSYQKELYDVIPENFFLTLKGLITSNNEDVLAEKKEELNLQQQYRKLMNQTVFFQNEKCSLNSLKKYFSDSNRQIRKEASEVYNNFFLEHQEEFDDIYFRLVQIRNKMAKKLSINSYASYSLILLRRFGYDYSHIRIFRENIRKYILPIYDSLLNIQKQNLEVENLMFYDNVFFKDGDVKPLYDGKYLLEKMKEVFGNISEDLLKLYNELLENGYIDVLSRDNKASYSITHYLVREKLPVISANFKNTSDDIRTISHEMGHGFQKYIAGQNEEGMIVPPILKYPTFEVAEMFSYAMEFISLDYIQDLFSKDDYEKYYLISLKEMIFMLPYIALVDHFQEEVYLHPEYTKEDYHQLWINLSKTYHQDVWNEGHPNLEHGNYFFRQNHIFLNPCYYIDYAISYFGAISLWESFITDKNKGLEMFSNMAKDASNIPLYSLIKKYHLEDPFQEESMKKLSLFLERKLKNEK